MGIRVCSCEIAICYRLKVINNAFERDTRRWTLIRGQSGGYSWKNRFCGGFHSFSVGQWCFPRELGSLGRTPRRANTNASNREETNSHDPIFTAYFVDSPNHSLHDSRSLAHCERDDAIPPRFRSKSRLFRVHKRKRYTVRCISFSSIDLPRWIVNEQDSLLFL